MQLHLSFTPHAASPQLHAPCRSWLWRSATTTSECATRTPAGNTKSSNSSSSSSNNRQRHTRPIHKAPGRPLCWTPALAQCLCCLSRGPLLQVSANCPGLPTLQSASQPQVQLCCKCTCLTAHRFSVLQCTCQQQVQVCCRCICIEAQNFMYCSQPASSRYSYAANVHA